MVKHIDDFLSLQCVNAQI